VRIILEWILEKECRKCGLDSSDSGQEPVVGSCEHGNKLSDTIKGWEFID
jgi:hypothetical protein